MINRLRRLELTSPCTKGNDVRTLQKALVQRGYEIEPDGIFGSLTEWAVEKFQREVRLAANGIADAETQRILYARDLYLNDPYLMGSDVKEMQYLLARIGYDVTVDGVFGLQTRQAVFDFQAYFNLPEDGIIQGKTLSQLLYLPSMAEAS